MSESIRGLLAQGVLAVTKDWAKIKKQEERDRRQTERRRERYFRGSNSRVTVKEAAYILMRDGYMKASGGGHLPANARQIMYAIRGRIEALTEQTLNDVYFTQVLVPDYIRQHPDQTATWDVVYDARGHLWEPHSGEQVGLGTLEVRDYLRDSDRPPDLDIKAPRLSSRFPTRGPRNRYNAVLYIEKEGFLPLLERARFAERYDLAIMSSKGMGTTAARTLIERLSKAAVIFVLHDFDKAGFSILGTLTRDTRRYEYARRPRIVDLGLRLADVEKWGLESESVDWRSDARPNLKVNGATPEEVQFLCPHDWKGSYGLRVELNAFSSDQFVEWLDGKLTSNGVKKVIPGSETLEHAYRRAAAVREYQKIIDEAQEKVIAYTNDLSVPHDLAARLAVVLADDPALSWDRAVQLLEAGTAGTRRD